jgi:3'-phosphoadenosine 5'-phosphosulfate sulfotransferase (PAPS reductase)/FAD synthetase
MSINRIRQAYERWNGQVYVSVSGGLDSTVLAHIVRSIHPDVSLAFFDTGLEYPENRALCKELGAEFIKPKRRFLEVIQRVGYPVVSKRVSQYVGQVQSARRLGHDDAYIVRCRLEGLARDGTARHHSDVISAKRRFLCDAPFKISAHCCHHLKRWPAMQIQSRGLKPMLGVRAGESEQRGRSWYQYGCNVFDGGNPRSMPLSFWTHDDIWAYIRAENVRYSALYDMGYKRSGCMFCMFGLHMEGHPNRFERMKDTHPKQYAFCMGKCGLAKVIEYVESKGKGAGPLYPPEARP